MSYVVIEDFRYGQDTRKSAITAPPGTLRLLKNAHITRGGEIEKAKAWVSKYALPAGNTKGMASTASTLYVFGSSASPGTIPTGVTYQQLVHPDNSTLAITQILDAKAVTGKMYAIAQFEDGSIFHYYDGALVKDEGAGKVRTGMIDNMGIASHLATLIDPLLYTVSTLGNVVTITSVTTGVPFTITATAVNGGSSNDQTAVVATTVPAATEVLEQLATAKFRLTAGSQCTSNTATIVLGAGITNGTLTSIKVGIKEILGATVNFNTNVDTTGAAISTQINIYNAISGIGASYDAGTNTLTLTGRAGAATPITLTGTLTMGDTANYTVTQFPSTNFNAITSIKVDGVEITSTYIPFSGYSSLSDYADVIIGFINSYTSSPDYTASRVNSEITLSAVPGSGASANGLPLQISLAGDVLYEYVPDGVGQFLGGVTAVAAVAQTSTVTIDGTFEVGDKFTINLAGYPYGYDTRPTTIGKFVLPLRSKLYITAASILNFSAINQPTKQSSEDTGAGFIDMSNQAAGSEDLLALAPYFSDLAIFARHAIQIWDVNSDPAQNEQFQVIPGTGTYAAKSVMPFGEESIHYLSINGFRSIRARDSSNRATLVEVGSPIDEDVKTFIKSLSVPVREAAVAVTEPIDNRAITAVSDKQYVYSFFSGAKVSAWSEYQPGLVFTEFTVIDRQMFGRAGDTIYLYGGDDEDTYSVLPTVAQMPFTDMKQVATFKELISIDVGLQGLWTVDVCTDPNQPTTWERLAVVSNITFNQMRLPAQGLSSHFALRFTSEEAAYGKISNCVIHYEAEEQG